VFSLSIYLTGNKTMSSANDGGIAGDGDREMEREGGREMEREGGREMEHATCKLCEYTGCGNYKFTEIMNFVSEHVNEVHIDELCAQVKQSLQEHLSLTLSHQQIKKHFLYHQCDQKIILNNILRELVPLVSVARCNCVVTQENATTIDPKSMTMYLDTVKQVMGIYKHLDAMKGYRK
jgi:hypothetical protein